MNAVLKYPGAKKQNSTMDMQIHTQTSCVL